MEIKGIEVSGEVYDVADENARTVAKANQTNIGTLDDLTTEEKSNLVEAINEVASGGGGQLDKMFFGSTKTVDLTFDFFNCYSAEEVLEENAEAIAKFAQLKKGILFVNAFQDFLGDSGNTSNVCFFTGQCTVPLTPSDNKETSALLTFFYNSANSWGFAFYIISGNGGSERRRTLCFEYEGRSAYYTIDGNPVIEGSDLQADVSFSFSQYE